LAFYLSPPITIKKAWYDDWFHWSEIHRPEEEEEESHHFWPATVRGQQHSCSDLLSRRSHSIGWPTLWSKRIIKKITPILPPCLAEFQIQCKFEPCSGLVNSTDEDLPAFINCGNWICLEFHQSRVIYTQCQSYCSNIEKIVCCIFRKKKIMVVF